MPLDYIEDKDIAGNAASSIIGSVKNAVVSTGADLVATLYNSTVGLVAKDIPTQDILTRVDKDALAFYNEHREGVEAASFLAGIIAPQAATLKLLGMVKNGATALGKSNSMAAAVGDVFSGNKAQALQSELRVLMENARYDDKLYNTTMRRLYATKISENAIDAAIFEATTVGVLNAHPYMEDYMESPYSNFALWAMVGGGIGGGLGIIQARSAVRDTLGGIVTEAKGRVGLAIESVNQAMPAAAQIQVRDMNIRNLSAILADETANPLTKQVSQKILEQQQGFREELIQQAAPWLKPKGKNEPSEFIELKPAVEKLLAMPEMMGVDRIKLPNMKFIPKGKGEKLVLEVDMLERPTKEVTDKIATLEANIKLQKDVSAKIPEIIGADGKTGTERIIESYQAEIKQLKEQGTTLKTVFYRPSTGDLYDRNLAGASALAVDLKGYKVTKDVIKGVNLYIPAQDSFIRTAAREVPSAVQDANYLAELAAWNKIDIKDIINFGIAPDDLARLNAAVTKQSKFDAATLETIQYNLRSDLPSFQQTTKFIESGAAGVKATHIQDIARISKIENLQIIANLENYKNMGSGSEKQASIRAFDMLNNWQSHVDNISLRKAMDAYLRRSTGVADSKEVLDIKAAELIWKSGQKYRDELTKIADAEGYVYLYRGIHGQIKGHAAVEGYTVNERTAQSFGSARLFKVHVDNVIGRIGGSEYASEAEILVTAPHQQIVKNLPVEGKANTAVVIPGAKSQNTVNGIQLVQHYTAETERQIHKLIEDNSFAAEEIAARLNTTKEAVLLVAAGRNLDEIPNWRRYTDADKIESEYLNPKNRIVALQGNPNTVNPIKLSASLDDRFLSAAHQQFVGQITAKHKNPLANALADLYSPLDDPLAAKEMHLWLDQLKQNIGEINNVLIKDPFFQSVDMALRNIQDGPLITYIGKRVSDIQDAQIKRVLEPVGVSMKGLGQSQAALVEFNSVENKLLSLTGWKGWRTDEETGFRYIVQRETRGGTVYEVPVKNADGSVYLIKTPEAINAIEGTFAASREILGLHNLNRELRGQGPLNDLGIYLPPPNLTNKFFSYVLDNSGKSRTSVLYANTAEDLAALESAYKSQVIARNPTMQIVNRGKDQDQFNLIHGYMDGDPYMQIANNQLKHAGASASAIIPGDARRITDIMEGYQHQILSGMRKYNEMYLNDITQKLDAFSQINQRLYANQPLRGFFKEKGNDAALTVKNALLGVSNLNQFTTWKSVNEFVDMAIVNTGRALDNVTGTFSKSIGSKEHFEKLEIELAQKGIQNPWENFQMYQASIAGAPAINSKRVVSAANGMMGTLMLRFLEMGHPLVNAISLPILTSGALMEGLPKTTLANGERITLPLRLPMDGARFRFNPKGIELQKQWEQEGLIDQVVRNYNDITGKLQVPATTKGAANELTELVESLQKSRVMEMMSTPSDFVEKWTRSQTMLTGFLAAKHAYPGISDRGATIYATAMADKVIGNYHAAQRPGLFQGTFGAVLGLFQTYMVTYGQHVYRTIEHGQYKALASTMAMQAGIFGTSSWPGYEQLSKFIGEHMSNQNYDLTTGTYRAVGDPMAEVILYGLPSNLGPSLYTRGDIAPRIPSQFGDLAIVNSTVGVYNAVSKMLGSVINQPGFEGKLQGIGEALSLQTLSRPIARASEIAIGESITRKGQTVATSDDVWTFNGIFARLLSVRPLEEQVTRNALQLNSYYGAADHDNRQNAVNKLRTALRAGKMDDDLVESVADYYLKHGGSNKGWNAVMNEIMTRTEEGTSYDLLRKLEPDSPLRRMLKDTF